MTSPFDDDSIFTPSLLTFNRKVLAGETDERGNPTSTVQSMTLKVVFLQGLQTTSSSSNSGRNTASANGRSQSDGFAEGYLIDPMVAPLDLVPGAKGTGTIAGETGEVTLVGVVRSAIPVVTEELGDKIQVSFHRQISWGEAK